MGFNHLTKPRQILRHILKDYSAWSLIVSNLITIIWAVIQHWSILEIMWIYWSQSVIIGFFNFIRILMLKDFSTDGCKLNGKSVEPTRTTKINIAFFFAVHYGLFHIGYAVFLFADKPPIRSIASARIDITTILITAGIFFVNHLFSFIYNRNSDAPKPNIGTIMVSPYGRIIPMHLTIVSGVFLAGNIITIVFFLILKTVADVVMHVAGHMQSRYNQENTEIIN